MYKIKKYLFIIFVTSLVTLPAFAQQKALFVTFSQQSASEEGDNDFKQSIYVSLPNNPNKNYQLQIFDPEIGGSLDEEHQGFDSATQFTLLKATTDGSYQSLQNNQITFEVIKQKTFSNNQELDSTWVPVFDLPNENIAKYEKNLVIYRIDVAGLAGNDGNVFDVRVVEKSQPFRALKQSTLFSFEPTIYIPIAPLHYANLRFLLPENTDAFTFKHFDIDKAEISFESLFNSSVISHGGDNGKWHQQIIKVKKQSTPQLLSLNIAASEVSRNALGVSLFTNNHRPLAVLAPFNLSVKNNRPKIALKVNNLESCQTVLFDASQSTDIDGDPLNFQWLFGDGQSASGARVSHTYSYPGTYKAQLKVFDQAQTVGRGALKNIRFKLNTPPEAKFISRGTFAPNKNMVFDASKSSDIDGKIVKYLWDFGDGTQGVGKKVSHRFSQYGVYPVSLSVVDNSNSPCKNNQITQKITINSAPIVDIGSDKLVAIDEAIDFVAANIFDVDNQIKSYLWDFGDGTTANSKEAKHQYSKAGTYTVSLTVVDDSFAANNTTTDKITVKVNAPPKADAGKDQNVSVLQRLKFDATQSLDSDGEIEQYQWDFGDGLQAEGKVVSHAYKKAGSYVVTLTVKDNSKTRSAMASDTLNVNVNAKPVAKAKFDYQQNSSVIQFNASKSVDEDGAISAYHWQFGDGVESFEKNPLHAYGNPGEYKVTLTVTDDSQSQNNRSHYYFTVKVNAAPTADAGGNKVVAPNVKVHFDGSKSWDSDGNIASYLWTLPDGTERTEKQISYVFKQPGDYPVSLKVTDLDSPAQTALDSIKVHVNYPPSIKLPKKVLLAPNQSFTFDASKAIDKDGKVMKTIWRFSDSNKRYSQASVLKSFKESGIYFAHLTLVDDAGVENSIVKQKIMVEVNNQPIAIAGDDVLTCEASVTFDGSESLDADNDTLSYLWDFGDGSKKKQGAQTLHTYRMPGAYPVVLRVNDNKKLNNSEDRDALTVRINEPPIADAGADKVSCAGSNIVFDGGSSFDAKGGLLKYSWRFGDGSSGAGISPTKIYKKGGTYSVKLKVEDNTGLYCGQDEDEVVVKVVESPVANAGNDIQACANSTIKFDGSKSTDADGLVNSFFWDFGDSSNGGGATPEHAYTKAGVYNVKLTITGDQIQQCDSTDSDYVKVTVLSAPVAKILAVDHVALSEIVEFDGTQSSAGSDQINQWLWTFGDGTSAEGEVVEHQYNKPGRYHIKLMVKSDANSQCNETSADAVVVVNAPPIANAGKDQQAEVNDIIAFDASLSKDSDGGIINYFWDFGDGTEQSGVRVDHQYQKAGKYTVKLIVTDDSEQKNNQAEDTLMVTITEAQTVSIQSDKNLICSGETLDFKALGLSETASLIWSVNDVDIATKASNTQFTFNGKGTQTVKLRKAKGDEVIASKVIQINQPPIIQVADIPVLCAGEKAILSAKNSHDDYGKVSEIKWKIGKSYTKGSTLQAKFNKAGRYPFVVQVKDDSGLQCDTATQQGIIRINNPPKANAGGDRTVYIGSAHDEVILDAKLSTDADKDSLNYQWLFSDGTVKNGKTVSYKWQQTGQYKVKLLVSDNTGSTCATDEDQITVTVKSY